MDRTKKLTFLVLICGAVIILILIGFMAYMLVNKKATVDQINAASLSLELDLDQEENSISELESDFDSLNVNLTDSTELVKNTNENSINLETSISTENLAISDLNLIIEESENRISEIEEENKTVENKIVAAKAPKKTTNTVKAPSTSTSNSEGWMQIAEGNRERWIAAGYADPGFIAYAASQGVDYMDLKYHYSDRTLKDLSNAYWTAMNRKANGLDYDTSIIP